MFRIIFPALIALSVVSAPAHAAVVGEASFSADRDSRTVLSFHDHSFPFSKECSTESKNLVTLAVRGANNGTIISEGCWELMENGDTKIHLSDRYPLHGVMIIKKSSIEKF